MINGKKKNTAREPLATSIHHVSEWMHRTPIVALEVKTLAPEIRVSDGTLNALAFLNLGNCIL